MTARVELIGRHAGWLAALCGVYYVFGRLH